MEISELQTIAARLAHLPLHEAYQEFLNLPKADRDTVAHHLFDENFDLYSKLMAQELAEALKHNVTEQR